MHSQQSWQKVIDSQLASLSADAIICTVNRKKDLSLYTRAEKSAQDQLTSCQVARERKPRQDWYITALRLGRKERLKFIDTDFIGPGGMISGASFKLAQLHSKIAKPKACDTVLDCGSKLESKETRQISKTQQQLFVCHVCITVGSWHDSVSCPSRYLLCSTCQLVGHEYKHCQSQSNPVNYFWATAQDYQLYSRQVPKLSDQFYLDRLLKLTEDAQITLVREKAPEFTVGLPDLNAIKVVFTRVANQNNALLQGQYDVPRQHFPFKLYCPVCRGNHLTCQLQIRPFKSKSKFEQNLNTMISSQKGKLKRYMKFQQSEPKFSTNASAVICRPRKRDSKLKSKEEDTWDSKFQRTFMIQSEERPTGTSSKSSQSATPNVDQNNIEYISVDDVESVDVWARPRDENGNLVEVSMQMREALGFWK